MIDYSTLNKEFVQAVQQGNLSEFIERMNSLLENDSRDFLPWLFIGKSYEALGDIEKSARVYQYILRATDTSSSVNVINNEIINFARRYEHAELLGLTDKFVRRQQETPRQPSDGQPAATAGVTAPPPAKPVEGTNGPAPPPPAAEGRVRIVPLRKKFSSDEASLPAAPPAPPPTRPKGDAKKPVKPSARSKTATLSPAPHEGGKDAALGDGPAKNVDELVAEAYKALGRGEVETATAKFEKAFQRGMRKASSIITLAQTLQRLQRYDEAIRYIEIGIASSDITTVRSLIDTKAQILQTQRRWDEAATVYERLLRYKLQPAYRRYVQMVLVSLYRKLGKADEAKNLILQVLEANPEDQIAIRIQAQLNLPETYGVHNKAIVDDETLHELQVDLPDDNIDLISPMLQRDLTTAEFRDEMIISQGGVPTVSDATRLLKLADETQSNEEFGDRYPRFLEAAKAFNELPGRSYDERDFYRALTRYATLKGGALVSDIRRQLVSGRPDLQRIRRLRDSATSYFLESLSLQMQVDVKFALASLASYLRAQTAYAMAQRGETVTAEHFRRKFDDLLKYCLEHPDDSIANIAYESVVAWGAASGQVWNRLGNAPGGAGVIGRPLEKDRRERPYNILSSITGQSFDIDQKPRDVLSKSFLSRRQQIREVLNYFVSLERLPLNVENFRELNKLWGAFPRIRGVLLETDFEIVGNISTLLTILAPFRDRSPEERTNILFTARVSLENLLRFIQENPTYWGRSWFEPMLTRWQSAIRSIEQRRLSDILPKLLGRLEPPVFRPAGDLIEGGILLRNEGRGTAEGAHLYIEIADDSSGEMLYQIEDEIKEEIKAKAGTTEASAYYYSIKAPQSALKRGLDTPYKLRVLITPVFSQAEVERTEQEFTLEVQSGHRISKDDIPWNEVSIPQEHMFKGREYFINHLVRHLESRDRNKTYILYGLSRTGKTSILKHLQRVINLKSFQKDGEAYRLITFMWDIGEAKGQTNAGDMWGYLLEDCTIQPLQQLSQAGQITGEELPKLRHPGSVRFKDWESLLKQLEAARLYPVFLLDEFSFFREMVDAKRVDSSFLAAVRNYAIQGKASFIIAGTYDLRKLVADPAYGVRGQLANTNEVRVSRIERDPATALIKVMEPQLKFTPDAVEHILWLSYQIPFFIQLICKQCALYAADTGRSFIGFPEVETVIKFLTGETEDEPWQGAERISPTRFHSNMYMPTDPPPYTALLTTICYLTQGQTHPRMVTYAELQEVWHRRGLGQHQAKMAECITELTEREVLISGKDEDEFAYRISVDLFRRWWANEHKNLGLELDALKQDL
jgi:tetratricopeptide (TPR) repeat protein